MPLAQNELQLVSDAVRELSFRTTGRALADVQEGALKVTLLEVLLDAGCIVYEATTTAGCFWAIQQQNAVVTACSGQQLPPTPGYKPDLRARVVGGNLIVLELKCRPAFGSKAQANYAGIRSDLIALTSRQCNALIFVADEHGYDTMAANREFAQLCPPREQVANMGSVSLHRNLTWNDLSYRALGTRMPSGYEARERAIVAWY